MKGFGPPDRTDNAAAGLGVDQGTKVRLDLASQQLALRCRDPAAGLPPCEVEADAAIGIVVPRDEEGLARPFGRSADVARPELAEQAPAQHARYAQPSAKPVRCGQERLAGALGEIARAARSAMIGGVEPAQHLFQNMAPVIVPAHAVTAEQQDSRVRPRFGDQLADRRVERAVNGGDGIAAKSRLLGGVEARMAGVVQVPQLMAGGVAFSEHRDEQVPGLLVEQVGGEPRLDARALDQSGQQRPVLGARAVAGGTVHLIVGCECRAPHRDPDRRSGACRSAQRFRRPGRAARRGGRNGGRGSHIRRCRLRSAAPRSGCAARRGWPPAAPPRPASPRSWDGRCPAA